MMFECATKREMGIDSPELAKKYFSGLWDWFLNGGANHVVSYLRTRSIANFSAANGQRKTEAHKDIVAASLTGDVWLLDALDQLSNPPVVRVDSITAIVERNGGNRKEFSPRLHSAMTRAGYRQFRSPDKDGRWRYPERRTTVFARVDLKVAEVAKLQPGLTLPF